jgi:hypothetical protein
MLLGLLRWSVALVLLGGLFALAHFVNQAMVKERAREASDESIQAPQRAVQGVIKLSAKLVQLHGLQVESARSTQWAERVPVYGRVIPNPKATAEVRAAFAGTLRDVPGRPWPAPGRWVSKGDVLGKLEIRVGPQERLDLQAKRDKARVELQGAEDILKIQEARAERLKSISGPKNVFSGKELDEALVDLARASTALKTAKKDVELWENALAEIDRQSDQKSATWSQPLLAPADGEVTELVGRPGMVVEAGGVVARLVDFRQALVRLDFPPEALAAGPPRQIELLAQTTAPPALRGAYNRPEPDSPARTVVAQLVGAAPQVDAASQFAGYLYEVSTHTAYQVAQHADPNTLLRPEEANHGLESWRPGLLVKTYVRVPEAKPREAVAVPATALLYHQGRALVYVRLSSARSERYQRREVQVLGREGDRWVLAGGVAAGEDVVSRQAQVLLSEEFKGDVDND